MSEEEAHKQELDRLKVDMKQKYHVLRKTLDTIKKEVGIQKKKLDNLATLLPEKNFTGGDVPDKTIEDCIPKWSEQYNQLVESTSDGDDNTIFRSVQEQQKIEKQFTALQTAVHEYASTLTTSDKLTSLTDDYRKERKQSFFGPSKAEQSYMDRVSKLASSTLSGVPSTKQITSCLAKKTRRTTQVAEGIDTDVIEEVNEVNQKKKKEKEKTKKEAEAVATDEVGLGLQGCRTGAEAHTNEFSPTPVPGCE